MQRMKRPASWWGANWREGTPLGNGLHGMLIYGYTSKEKIMLTHSTLWREGRQMDIPDVSDVLPEMRKLIFDGRAPEADNMINEALKLKGYHPGEAFPFPAADINILLPATVAFSKYSRSLDMEHAQAQVDYNIGEEKINRRGFVSRKDDVVVIECHKDSQISITAHIPDLVQWDPDILPKNQETKIDGEWILFKASIDEMEHGVVARVIKNDKTLIIARVFTTGNSEIKWKEYKSYIESLPDDYETLFERHAPLHKELFNRCRFELSDNANNHELTNEELLDISYDDELPNALTQRMWEFGRYLFICATQPGGLPCNLTGIWSGDYRAFWAFNMANVNLEMTYWHVLSGNLTEMMLPFFDYYDSGIEDFKENAKKLYGCSGIFLPAVTMPGHMKHLCLAPHITNWTAGAGWIAQHYYDYYIYTNDKEFLEKRAVPFMKETAKFYVEFVVWQRDHWHVCPSVSPENHTRNYRRNAKDLGESRSENDLEDGAQTSIDSTMDIAVIKELFYNLLEISNTTNLITPEERKSYEKIIKGAIDYKINEFGAPREWLHEDFPDNDYHRHQSHLFPMFPGLEKTRIDEATNRMFRQGGLRRMTIGLGYQTSWSLIQNGNLMARVCDGELAFQSLNLIAKSCIMRNLFTTHNDWRRNGICLAFPIAPFQIDANIGWPSVIQEMLLFSNKNRLDILPALPRKWYKGKIGELRARCGVETTIEWDEKNYSTRITALRDTNFDLFLPDGSCEKIIMSKGEILLRKNH